MERKLYAEKLERNLMMGSGRWVADFREGFINYPIGDVTFDLMVRGGTRSYQGFFLSRAYTFLVTPNYFVSCFLRYGDLDGSDYHSVIRAVS